MRLALYQPDIPQNAAALMRLGACLGIPIDIIEPCGFVFSDKGFKRAGLDYAALAEVVRHDSWERFLAVRQGRLVLLTTRAARAYTDFAFSASDILIAGRESAGVPDAVHGQVDARLKIPLKPGLRSINVAQAVSMVLGEALRQTEGFPK